MWSGLLLMQTVRPLDPVLSLMVRQGWTLLFYLLKDLVAASSLGESTGYFAPGWRCFAVHYKVVIFGDFEAYATGPSMIVVTEVSPEWK